MALILALETSTKNCSVALFNNGNLVAVKEQNSDGYMHAEQLTLFVNAVLKEGEVALKNLDAIALSKGPGSYTGLRIGTSTAKGLCYALDIPLISISTLQAMAFGIAQKEEYALFCPMIDARRMEVFAAIFDSDNKEIRAVNADVVDEDTYSSYLDEKVLFFGDGAIKCKAIINNTNAYFIEDIYPSAINLGVLADIKFQNMEFEDVAYFEPFYLKDFVAGKKKA